MNIPNHRALEEIQADLQSLPSGEIIWLSDKTVVLVEELTGHPDYEYKTKFSDVMSGMWENFKNRITQETPNTIKQLKSLWIDMSSDKQLTPNTPNGLFAFTLNPNNFVDAVKLETDFKSI